MHFYLIDPLVAADGSMVTDFLARSLEHAMRIPFQKINQLKVWAPCAQLGSGAARQCFPVGGREDMRGRNHASMQD